ncbi:ABC transporter permease [Roseovarius aestuarii]|nr:ABC transporter permease [Roseovarius aestuarii]
MFSVARLIAVRLIFGCLALFLVSMLIFMAIELLPGDFAEAVLGRSATPETVDALRRQMGLDQPAIVRYFSWIGGAIQGDFGVSMSGFGSDTRQVADMIGPRLFNTVFLAIMAAICAVPVALSMGVLTALWRNSVFDRVASVATLIAISLPEFFVAYLLSYFIISKDMFAQSQMGLLLPDFVSQGFGWLLQLVPSFPTLAIIDDAPFWEQVWRLSLPAITLTLVSVAHMMRMTRAVLISLLSSPYIEMARLKGLSPMRVILHHALRNAWAPIATVVAFNLAYLIAGVVVVEVVFVYPGIGQLMVDAVKTRDIPVVQACALIFAAAYIVLNLIADLVAIISNPRLLYPR